VTPIGFTLAMLDVDTQQKVDSWRMMATIPNLSAKKGSNKKKVERATQCSFQDMHNVLRIAFSSLEESWKEGGIVWHAPDGEVKILKPYIYMVIGDTVGNNELVAHYLGNTQGTCLVKDCKCCKEDLVKVPPKCCQMTYKTSFCLSPRRISLVSKICLISKTTNKTRRRNYPIMIWTTPLIIYLLLTNTKE
jgi:hypothetical protein